MNLRHSTIAGMTASLMLAGAGIPALAAQDQVHAVVRPGDSQPSGTSGSRSSAQSDRRICVDVEMTGTRVKRRVCRTEAEWQVEGGLPSEG